jgi:hypothetical protein
VSAGWESLVPEAQHDPVREALAATYGSAMVECPALVTGGASGAVTLRLASGARQHLLRVETSRSPMRNPHQYACMTTAAEAGIAPPLHYADDAGGVAIMDFIDTVPLDRFPGGDLARARALAELTGKLQGTELFPALGDWRAIVGRLLTLLESKFAEGLLAPHRAAFEKILDRLSWDAATHVSSHNDPNARNVLFDGKRLWLVDWETAYRNDSMVDVAILADNLAATPELAGELLRTWLARAPTATEAQRLEDVRRLTRLYYAALLIGFAAGPVEPIGDLAAPTRAQADELQRRGELTLPTPDTLLVAGKMCLAAFLESETRGARC